MSRITLTPVRPFTLPNRLCRQDVNNKSTAERTDYGHGYRYCSGDVTRWVVQRGHSAIRLEKEAPEIRRPPHRHHREMLLNPVPTHRSWIILYRGADARSVSPRTIRERTHPVYIRRSCPGTLPSWATGAISTPTAGATTSSDLRYSTRTTFPIPT